MKNKILALVLTSCVVVPAGIALSSCGEEPTPPAPTYTVTGDVTQANFGDSYSVYLNDLDYNVGEGQNSTFKVCVPEGLDATNMTVSINGSEVSLDLGRWTYENGSAVGDEIDDCRARYWTYTIKKVKSNQNILVDASNCTKAILTISYGDLGDDLEFYTLKEQYTENSFGSTTENVYDVDVLGDATYFDNLEKQQGQKVQLEHGKELYVKVPIEIVENYDIFVNSDEKRQIYSVYDRYNSGTTREYPYVLNNGYIAKVDQWHLGTKNVTLEKEDPDDYYSSSVYENTFAFILPNQLGYSTTELLTEVEIIDGKIYYEISQARYNYILETLQAEAARNGYIFENYGYYIEQGGKYYAYMNREESNTSITEFDGKKYVSTNTIHYYGKAYGNANSNYDGLSRYIGDNLAQEEIADAYTFAQTGKIIIEVGNNNVLTEDLFMSDDFIISIAKVDEYLSEANALAQPFTVVKRLVETAEYSYHRMIVEIDFDMTKAEALEQYFSTYSGKRYGKGFIHMYLSDDYINAHYTEINSNLNLSTYSSNAVLSMYEGGYSNPVKFITQKGKNYISNVYAQGYEGQMMDVLKPIYDESVLNDYILKTFLPNDKLMDALILNDWGYVDASQYLDLIQKIDGTAGQNTYTLQTVEEIYHAVILLQGDARKYAIVNYDEDGNVYVYNYETKQWAHLTRTTIDDPYEITYTNLSDYSSYESYKTGYNALVSMLTSAKVGDYVGFALDTFDVTQTNESGFTLVGTNADFSQELAQVVEFIGVEGQLTCYIKDTGNDEAVYVFTGNQGDIFAYIKCSSGNFYYAYDSSLEREGYFSGENIVTPLFQKVEVFKFDCADLINSYSETYRIYSYDNKVYFDSNEENDNVYLEKDAEYLLSYRFDDPENRNVANVKFGRESYRAILIESISEYAGYYVFNKDGENYYVRLDMGGHLFSLCSSFDTTNKLSKIYYFYNSADEVIAINQGYFELKFNYYDYDLSNATISYSYVDDNGVGVNESIDNLDTLNAIYEYGQDNRRWRLSRQQEPQEQPLVKKYWSGSVYKEIYDAIVSKYAVAEDPNVKVYSFYNGYVFETENDKFYVFNDLGNTLVNRENDANIYQIDYYTNQVGELDQYLQDRFSSVYEAILAKYEIVSVAQSNIKYSQYGYIYELDDNTFYVFDYNGSRYAKKAGDDNVYRFNFSGTTELVDLNNELDWENKTELQRLQENIDFDIIGDDIYDLEGKTGVGFATASENISKFMTYLKAMGENVEYAEVIENGEFGYVIRIGNEQEADDGYYFFTNIETGKLILYSQNNWYYILENNDKIYGLEKVCDNESVRIARFVDMDLSEEVEATSTDEVSLYTLEHELKFDKFYEGGAHTNVEFYIPTENGLTVSETVLTSDKLAHITSDDHNMTITLKAGAENSFVYFYSTMKDLEIIKEVEDVYSDSRVYEAKVVAVNAPFGEQISVKVGSKRFYLFGITLGKFYGDEDLFMAEKVQEIY